MAINVDLTKKSSWNTLGLTGPVGRQNALPSDYTEMWSTYDDALNYAISGATAYVGQIIYAQDTGKHYEIIASGETFTLRELGSGGGGSEPDEYLKRAAVSGNTLTLTKKDNTTVVFTPSGSSSIDMENGTGTNSIQQKTGDGITASAPRAMAVNRKTKATGNNSFAANYSTEATGDSSFACGVLTKAQAKGSYAEGVQTVSGDTTQLISESSGSHAEGYNSTAMSPASHAEGLNNITGNSSVTIPSNSQSDDEQDGDGSSNGTLSSMTRQGEHAEGVSNQSIGSGAHSEGSKTVALGTGAHAEGYRTVAGHTSRSDISASDTFYEHTACHAEGSDTIASAEAAHAEGHGTIASAYASHAQGTMTQALHDQSCAMGSSTTTTRVSQLVCGQLNDTSNDNALFIVGNGASYRRSNAFVVDFNGDAFVGRTTQEDASDLTVATKKYVDDHTGTGEPDAYIKSAQVSANNTTLTLTQKDDTTVTFSPVDYFLRAIQGYNASKTQLLKQVNGTFQWVDDYADGDSEAYGS